MRDSGTHSPLEFSACPFAAESEVAMLVPVMNRSTLLSSKDLVANLAFPASKMHVHNTDWTSHNRGDVIYSAALWTNNRNGFGQRILFRDRNRDRDPAVKLVDGYEVRTGGSLDVRNKTGT